MPIIRVLLILFALVSPSLAGDGASDSAAAQKATKAFQSYIAEVAKNGERPDPTNPEVAAWLAQIFDLGALNALPPPQANDVMWLLDWVQAGNTSSKALLLFGSKPGSQPDFTAIARNMSQYGDQYAVMSNFLIRATAREALALKLFKANLAPEQRTRIREEGFTKASKSAAEYILEMVCGAIGGATTPANAQLVSAAIRDTRDVWVDFFQPEDRVRAIKLLPGLAKQVSDETARADLAAFAAALQAPDQTQAPDKRG